MAITDNFDWDAFMRDTLEASCLAAGAWLRCLYKMRVAVPPGRLTLSLDQYARLFGESPDVADAIINEIAALNIGDHVREADGRITLTNRRIFRLGVNPSKTKPTRIPLPFPLTDEMQSWAIANVPQLRLESAHENFVEYWSNCKTAKAHKLNWLTTWKNGMRMALKWQLQDEPRAKAGAHDACPYCNTVGCLGGMSKSYCQKEQPYELATPIQSVAAAI